MSDSSVISSPQKSNTSGGSDTNSAFADAVQRARQLAAKIHSSGSENNSISSGTKRPLEDNMNGSQDGSPDVKKVASSNDPFGAQLAAMQQQRNGPTSDFVIEEYKVPDKMVGLIIGRGGEQIIRLQAESGCKIQLASDSGGLADRPCTLTGSRESVQTVKDMINQIISKANSPFPPGHAPDGQHVAEMMIPGPKVGLLIGKGGENIRNLQEKGGVKMVLIQDGPQQTIHDKPLRITGDPQKVEFAKQMVIDLLAQKDMERNLPNGVGANQEEIMVPRQAVGVIIGKGGDMIKRIQQDSGARVQFIQGKEDIPGDKICQITGTIDQVQKASSQIRDLIQSVLVGFEGMSQESYQTSNHEVRDQQMGGSSNSGSSGGGGRGRGRGRGFGGPGGGGMRSDFGPPGPRMGRPQEGMNEIQFAVPANKCGLVIGKGGETVRNINQQSGAHVEIAKGAPPNPHEKIFIIRGNPQQIEHAKQLISERVGGMPPGQSGPPGPNSQGPPGQFQPQYAQQFQQPGPGQAYAPPGWGNTYQHWQNQPAAAGVAVAPNDPAKAAADANAAAWAAYYAQFYNQPAQPQQPQPSQMQPQPQPQQQAQQQLQAQNAGAQPDYSAAWAEYYRSLGMFREAEMIEQQARTNQQGQGGQQPSPAPGAPMAPQPGGAAAPVPQPQQSQPPTQQPPTSAAPTGQAAQPPGAPAAGGPWQPGYPHQQGQQPPQTQVPYGQPSPYPGYTYAAYGGQQQFPVSAPQ